MEPFRSNKSTDTAKTTGESRVLSLLAPSEVEALGGMPGEAVVGVVEGEEVSPATVRPNRVFIDFMHRIIETAGPADADLKAAAARQGDGYVYIIDLRTPHGPSGAVPPEDIIGAFAVSAGRLGAYRRNDNHRVLTAHGMVRLPDGLRAALVAALPRVQPHGGTNAT